LRNEIAMLQNVPKTRNNKHFETYVYVSKVTEILFQAMTR